MQRWKGRFPSDDKGRNRGPGLPLGLSETELHHTLKAVSLWGLFSSPHPQISEDHLTLHRAIPVTSPASLPPSSRAIVQPVSPASLGVGPLG